MALLRGMSAMAGVIEENKRNQASSFQPWRFKLDDGETGYYLFIGSPETEPVYVNEHSVRKGKQFDTILHREKNCVACYQNTNGNRSVSRHSTKACYSLYDIRWQKKTLDRKRSEEEGQDRYNYVIVEEDEVTEKGKARGIFKRGGLRQWKMSGQWFQALGAVNTSAGKKCKSCLRGKITCIGYENKDGTKINTSNLSPGQIRKKLELGKLVERLKCSSCKKPVRKSIFNSIVAVTRAGSNTNTTYQFEILAEDDVPEDVLYELQAKDGVKPIDWDALLQEPTAQAQSQQLGVRNPFRGNEEEDSDDAEDYEDDEDEDDSDPFAERDEDDDEESDEDVDDSDDEDDEDVEDGDDEDEDDDDDRPRKKKSVLKKKVSSKKPLKKKVVKKSGLFKKPLKKKSVRRASGY